MRVDLPSPEPLRPTWNDLVANRCRSTSPQGVVILCKAAALHGSSHTYIAKQAFRRTLMHEKDDLSRPSKRSARHPAVPRTLAKIVNQEMVTPVVRPQSLPRSPSFALRLPQICNTLIEVSSMLHGGCFRLGRGRGTRKGDGVATGCDEGSFPIASSPTVYNTCGNHIEFWHCRAS